MTLMMMLTLMLNEHLQLHFDKLLNIATRETSALLAKSLNELADSLEVLAKPRVFDSMPMTRNEYYSIGTSLLTYMRDANPPLAKTASGRGMLRLAEKALRGIDAGDDEALMTFTLTAKEGELWGLPRGLIINGSIQQDFGYDGLVNNYHTPEYERLYARRMYLTRDEERIVFLSKDFLETEECFHVSTSAYSLFLDANKKYIPDVTLKTFF